MTQMSTASAAAGPLSDHELGLIDAYWRAANYLSVGQIYLLDNPLLREPLRARARQAATARPLGHDARAQLHLRPPEPGHPQLGPRRDLRHRARATAARPRSPTPTSRAPTARSTRTSPATRTGLRAAVPPVLVPGRHPLPRRPGDARLDPRGRRARLRPLPRLRRRLRQPRPAGLLRRRRRRGGDRPAGDRLALEQVPESRDRRRGAADPAPNGYKIANPTVLARIRDEELTSLLEGYGHSVHWVSGDDPAPMHQQMAATLDTVVERDPAHPAAARARAATAAARAGR